MTGSLERRRQRSGSQQLTCTHFKLGYGSSRKVHHLEEVTMAPYLRVGAEVYIGGQQWLRPHF
ncbi:hypothetical protein N7463_009166 [Penicillium fimorum]|uniref:Uncharacterized protein n=1 Tax=Penicillium fimorum TaxID=1882269 RepID=A0A9W9XRR4_9EURO|nr:hypothetical protein N7463_009166 [Penicillium fimorum]